MSEEHATLLLGAYVLDALEAAERRDVDRHLQQCPACAGELGELQPLPGLLAALSASDLSALDDTALNDTALDDTALNDTALNDTALNGASAAAVQPSPDLFARMTAAIDAAEAGPAKAGPAGRTERARLLRHPRLLIAAAVIVLFAATGAGFAITRAGATHHSNSTFSASSGAVHIDVDVTAARQGTTLQVSVAGLPVNEHCTLVAVASDGSRHAAGEWVATYAGKATVTGSTNVARSQLRQLVLLGTDGQALVSVSV